jgi:hypothetical protein
MNCSACDTHQALDTPVLVLRPGDPVACLLSLPGRTPTAEVLASADELVRDARRVVSAGAATSWTFHDNLTGIAGRYSGFSLAGVTHDEQQVDDGFDEIRARMVVPDVHAAVGEALTAEEDEVDQVLDRHPSLVDPAWALVYRTVHREIIGRQTGQARAIAQQRFVRLNRGRWPHDPIDEKMRSPAVQEILDGSDDLDRAGRLAVLDRLTRRLTEAPDERPVIIEHLMYVFIRSYEAPGRTIEDVETAVALLVGGIGVANTMIISVLERRREIGLRRSLGATRRHIRTQFLTEALLLSALGGVFGCGLGATVTAVMALTNTWPFALPAESLAIAVVATLAIGATAGLYPAVRAARTPPTAALNS